MLTDLADVLRGAGLKVVEVPGWKTRGHTNVYGGLTSLTRVAGIVCHHTAGPKYRAGGSDYPSLSIVRDGRPGLSGPLSQLGVGFDGTWYVIAAGIAYHSGPVNDQRYFNSCAIGIEAENPGDGSPWPAAQYDSYARGCAALQNRYGCAEPRGHKEVIVPKGAKVDPTFDMNSFRSKVASYRAGTQSNPSTPAKPSKPGTLTVDGIYGPATEAALMRVLRASKPQYAVRWVQDQLNKRGIRGYDGKPLTLDGIGLWSNATKTTPKTNTAYALQKALGTPADGVLSAGYSAMVAQLQRNLNEGKVL